MVLLPNSENKLGGPIGKFQLILRDSSTTWDLKLFLSVGTTLKNLSWNSLYGSQVYELTFIGSTRQDVKNSLNQKANLGETPFIKQTVQSPVLSLFLRIYGENFHSYSPLTFTQQSQLLGTN